MPFQIKLLFKKTANILCLLSLASCTYNLSLMQRGTGTVANGTAERLSHIVTINLKGTVYKGQFALVHGGGYGSFNSYGGGVAPVSGNMMMISAMVTGSIIAKSQDGKGLRCHFTASGNSGMGECQDDAKNIYDLQISL